MRLQEFFRNLCFDAEHEFLTFLSRFDRFGGELSDTVDEGNMGRYHKTGRGIQNDVNVLSDGEFTGIGFRHEKGHIHIAQIHQIQQFPPCAKDFSGLGDAVLYAAVFRRCQLTVVDVGADALNGGFHRDNLRFGADDLRFGCRDGGLSGGDLCLSGNDGGFGAANLRTIVIQFLYGGGIFLRQYLGAGQAPFGGIQFGFTLHHAGIGGGHVAFAYSHLSFGTFDGILGLLVLGFGFRQLGI